MSKITISSIGSGYSRSKINDAVQDITTELNNKVLYRDNPTGEPNQLEQELDMNSNVIANAKDIHTERLRLNGQWISANNLSTLEADSINYDNTSSLLTATSVQAAIDEVEGRTDTAETNITNASGRLDTNELAITAAEGRLDINEPAITAVEGRLDNVGDESVTTSTGTQTVETALDNRLISNTADDIAGTAALLNTGTAAGELPTNGDLGTAAVTDATDYATSAQGDTADSALQSSDIGVSVQAQSTVLDNTTASFTTTKDSKLTGIEVGATTDQTDSEIKTAYEANLDTNAFTDSEQTKLGNIEDNATADQSASEIKTAYESNADTNEFSDAEQTKLSGIEENATADQTKADIDGLEVDAGTLEGNAASAFATSAQGDTADSALQSSDIGTSLQAHSSVLDSTTASYTTAEETKLSNIEDNATADQDLSGKADIAGQVFTGEITYYGGGGVSSNTSYGTQSLSSNTTGNRNVASGYQTLRSNTTGYNNTATGYRALRFNTSYNNTATGYAALFSNTEGNDNTATGYYALFSNTSYNNTSGFGHDAQVTGSDQIQLGDSGTTTYVYGTVQDRSDLRDKADVRDTILGLDFITALRPVDYRWDLRDDYKPDAPTEPEPLKDDATEQDIQAHELALSQYENDCAEWLIAVKHENLIHDGTHKRSRYHHGVIAQEVAEVIAESGIDFGGYQDHKVSGGEDVLSIGYDELIGPLIKALQEVNQKFDALKEEFDDYVETHS